MSSSIRRLVLLSILVCAAGACSSLVPTPKPEVPRKILIVGDSNIFFNLGHSYHFERLAASANPPLDIDADDLTSGGCALRQLWEGPAALDLGLDGGTPTRQVQEVIASGDYDVVLLNVEIQAHAAAAPGYDLETQRQFAERFVHATEEAGSSAILYMVWPVNPELGAPGAATIDDVARWIEDMGKELGVPVAPAALAWQRAMEERPDLKLYADMFHPTIHGTYLGVCVVYATVLGKSPEALSYWPEDDGVTEEEAAFLQRVAWETVQQYEAL